MTLVVTHVLPEAGSEFHEQKLYHVPRETARQIASDFEAFEEKRLDEEERLAGEKRSGKEEPRSEEERRDGDARAPATNTYDYPLGAPDPTGSVEAEDESSSPSGEASSGEAFSGEPSSGDAPSGKGHDARGTEDARGQGEDGEEGPGEQPRGILSIDFRTVAAIQAYDRLS